MCNNNEVKTTTNSYVFNRLYKKFLEGKGKIRCSHCGYHRGENLDHTLYGHFPWGPIKTRTKYPNWKLVSKNPKQWMKKPLKKKPFKISRVWLKEGFTFKW